ncbi:CoA ester lyase [Arthrobacter sp. ov118]|uniref:HpcH/HpaI aldolase/citrate lyase family protein n=1 Tax=Arthrobacter sp. ov118 TaxID=1761747 RepID=UPI0008F186CC|nr:CoA ester lyase [Arthrobacter sp. ov118]SFU11779.1 citrate lyase subunit beta / citryl-CoA lyase [Arthrobacter sp. ov118]
MTSEVRPRRSALYVPGNNHRAMEKAKSLPADVLVFDLEDAVGDDAKVASRSRVCDAVASGTYAPREIVIRVNGLGTQWHDADLAAVIVSGADGVLVPKVETGEEVKRLTRELERQQAPDGLKLWVMIETPGSFLRAEEIASASDRLAALVIGTNDLINDIHGVSRPGRAPILTALSLAVLATKAAGKTILDGVYNNITDHEGFVAEAQQGRDMGFDGKTVIHPAQIEPANAAFGPSRAEVEHARTVVAAYQQALTAGESVIVVDGQMTESLHVRDAHRILALEALISDLGLASATTA